MSYILDALRRADAERQRGAVPGLHDQAGPTAAGGAATAPAAAPARSPWPWLAGGALLLATVGGAWWLGRGTAPAPPVAVAPPAPVPVQVQVQLTPPPPPPPPPPQPAPAAVVVPAPALPLPRRANAPVDVAPAATLRPGAGPGPSPESPSPAATPLAATPTPTPAVARAEAGADVVRPWSSLPEASRSALPALAWSGAVHAERAEQRLVIVNGQVAREGDTIASGVQLLQIRPKSVLVRWQGQRIEMPL